ncbi:MAG: acetate--CoA ligase family protein [Candidatus Micrarchaeota archaeon]|nr:acetate--CoA ligase family protein [Candidatus Micrarchaeota archaeon]
MGAADFSVLSKYKIPFPKFAIVQPSEDPAPYAKKLGFPLVMKALSPQVSHKTERGGVILGLVSAKQVQEAKSELLRRYQGVEIEGLLLQRMVLGKDSVELIVGGKRDEQFGQMIMLGMGGIFVEVMKDVSFRICPIEKEDALQMMRELRAYPVLSGARGRKPIDEKRLASVLLNASELLVKEDPDEFDINPLIAWHDGCMAVDVRIMKK